MRNFLKSSPKHNHSNMSRMAPMSQKKRKLEDGIRGRVSRPKKKFRKQKEYHSSSEDDNSDTGFGPVNLGDSDDDTTKAQVATKSNSTPIGARKPAPLSANKETTVAAEEESDDAGLNDQEMDQDDEEEDEVSEEQDDEDEDAEEDREDSDSATEGNDLKRKSTKRNDPEAFSTSISKILSTKLSQSARKDPVLSRSREAVEASSTMANERLEHRVKAKIRAEKKEDLQRGRIKDVLGLSTGETGQVAEEEKRLRKVAQRGVVKLFNAVRAAQVRGEQAAREERKKGTIGTANREEKVNEMSKQGFLDLISGKKSVPVEGS